MCEHAGIGRQARLRGVCLWRVGSSPTARTNILPDSVMVSTSDSDSLCLGSNPSQAAKSSKHHYNYVIMMFVFFICEFHIKYNYKLAELPTKT